MPRAFWKGVISFGLVAIPVQMSVATETKSISFHLLHKKCLTRPKQMLYCQTDNEYFGQKETVHGYEVTKGQFAVLDDNDFKKVAVKTSHSIDILGFVDIKEIDPIYYHGSHYVEPEELGTKPFQLLLKALEKTGLVGIAKVAFQRREHLCCLRPYNNIFILQTLYYQDEVLSMGEPGSTKTKVAAGELDMAVSLIQAMTTNFKPADYTDDYEQSLKQIVEAKVKGLQVIEPEVARAEITDIMAALRESLNAARKEKETVLK